MNSIYSQIESSEPQRLQRLKSTEDQAGELSFQKQVEIKNAAQVKIKVPLVLAPQHDWVQEYIVESTTEHELVYQMKQFKDSQLLLHHNLKVFPDPLTRACSEQTPTEFSLGEYPEQRKESMLIHEFRDGLEDSFSSTRLRFDSNYECGNLERAFRAKRQDGDTDIVRYLLLVHCDFNTKGHQQWFNFMVSNFQEDTVYELQIGPFKKPQSKFSEGLLPWMSEVTNSGGQGACRVNIAREHISHVSYSARKIGESTSPAFLTLRLQFGPSELQNTHRRHFLIAYSEPYSYSRLECLMSDLQRQFEQKKISKRLSLKIGRLCQSLGGVDVPLVKITQKSHETILSAFQKSIIVVSARVHPGEPPGSFLCEGFLKAILNKTNQASVEKLLAVAEIHVVPMLNPDGVIIGNSRVNLGGVDMNRRWGASVLDRNVTPEVFMLKEYLQCLKSRVLMYLDLHGHTKGEGIFFYACQPEVTHQKDDKFFNTQVLEKTILVRALPTLLGKRSPFFNLARNKYYSLKKDGESKKLNTARVVSTQELGIDQSYTVESSFFCYSVPNKAGVRKPLTQKTFVRAGADLLQGVYTITFTTLKLQATNKSILQFLELNQGKRKAKVKQDPFLEALRPMLNTILCSVKTKFVAQTIQNHVAQQRELSQMKRQNQEEAFAIQRFTDADEGRLGNVALVRKDTESKIQVGGFPIRPIPVPLQLHRQASEQSVLTDDLDNSKPVFHSTLNGPYNTSMVSQDPSLALFKGKDSPPVEFGSEVTPHDEDQSLSAVPSQAHFEARFSPHSYLLDSSESEGSSVLSGSESNPSEDNMESTFLQDLQSLIKEQRAKIEKYNHLVKTRTRRIQAFERGSFDATISNLKENIKHALIGDARSKSQMAEIQTKNHDLTLFCLSNNNVGLNSFIPNGNVLQHSRRERFPQNRATADHEHKMSQRMDESRFRFTERTSSIHSNSFFPADLQSASDQQARLDEILKNRNRNFETTNNLLALSTTVSYTPLNATVRGPLRQKKDSDYQQYSVLRQNQLTASRVFDPNEKNSQARRPGLGGLVTIGKPVAMIRPHLPQISVQAQDSNQEMQERAQAVADLHSHSTMSHYEQKKLKKPGRLTIESLTQHEVPKTWQVVPATLSTFRKSDAKQHPQLISLPLRDLIPSKSKLKINKEPLEFPTSNGEESSRRKRSDTTVNALSIAKSKKRLSVQEQHRPLELRRLNQNRKASVDVIGSDYQHQLRVVPTGQRPNNKGVLTTKPNIAMVLTLVNSQQKHVGLQISPNDYSSQDDTTLAGAGQNTRVRRVIQVNQTSDYGTSDHQLRPEVETQRTDSRKLESKQSYYETKSRDFKAKQESFESFGADESHYNAFLSGNLSAVSNAKHSAFLSRPKLK